MRILHVATRHRRGGAEKNISHMIRWQLERGHRVTIAVGPDSLREEVPESCEYVEIPALQRRPDPLADSRALAQLRRLMRDRSFDVVHTHYSKAGILGRAAAVRAARCVVHTVHMPSFGPAYSPLESAAFRLAERWASRHTDLFVAVGTELRDLYVDAGIGTVDRYLVIRSPIDVERFAAVRTLDSDERRRRRASFELPETGPLVVGVGTLERRKRFDLAMRKLAEPLRELDGVLAIAGSGNEEPALARAASGLGGRSAVRLLGHVDDVPSLLAGADALVHASATEGVPQVVVQALAAGVPVVATESEGLRELAGAPIRRVDRAGAGLADALLATLALRPPAVPVERLAAWRQAEVEKGIAELDDAIARIVEQTITSARRGRRPLRRSNRRSTRR